MSENVPAARIVRERRRWTWAWLVTIAAVAVGGWLVYRANEMRGHIVHVHFETASGLRAGDSVAYRGIPIGEVQRVRLDEQLQGVIVEAVIWPDAVGVAVEGSQWWVVRPEIGLRGISGLDALLGPRYLEVKPGEAGSRRWRRFEGLERAPDGEHSAPDALQLVLLADRRGSLEVGSPVRFRDMQVGSVRWFELAEDATNVRIGVDIEPDYAHLVRERSRFWKATGIGVDWGLFAGLSVRAESLETLIGGGIGFATPNRAGEAIENGHEFELAAEVDPDWLKWSPVLTEAD